MTTTLEPPELDTTPLTELTEPTAINADLFYQVLHQIMIDPKNWNQSYWGIVRECGTSYCIAGWTLVVSGNARRMRWAYHDERDMPEDAVNEVEDLTADDRTIEDVAGTLLGLSETQSAELFLEFVSAEGEQDIPALWEIVDEVTDGEITPDGYHRWLAARA